MKKTIMLVRAVTAVRYIKMPKYIFRNTKKLPVMIYADKNETQVINRMG